MFERNRPITEDFTAEIYSNIQIIEFYSFLNVSNLFMGEIYFTTCIMLELVSQPMLFVPSNSLVESV